MGEGGTYLLRFHYFMTLRKLQSQLHTHRGEPIRFPKHVSGLHNRMQGILDNAIKDSGGNLSQSGGKSSHMNITAVGLSPASASIAKVVDAANEIDRAHMVRSKAFKDYIDSLERLGKSFKRPGKSFKRLSKFDQLSQSREAKKFR